jgi:hypothetical protein
MAKYLFVYHGGKMATDAAEKKAAMDAWGAWFGSLGAAVVDGGNPVGPSSTVRADGSLASDGGANPTTGYSLISASNLEDAHAKARGCPLLKAGGTIEIAQAFDM